MFLCFNFHSTSTRALVLLVALFLTAGLYGQYEKKNYRNWMLGGSKSHLALVIGNSEYEVMGKLRLPAKDAEIVAAALHSQGADVLKAFNLDRIRMDSIIIDFGERLREYEVAIIYYAGHGFQVNGRNYLAPVDAHPIRPSDMDRVCYNVDELIRKIGDGGKPKLICLDACRNSPFPPGYTPPNRGQEYGFLKPSVEENFAFLFATQPRTIVSDDNPFAEALATSVSNGGCWADIVISTRLLVRDFNPLQKVWQEENLLEQVCFGEESANKNGAVQQSLTPPSGEASAVGRGASFVDKDGDGISNVDDNCPNDPGFAGNGGCPLEELDVWLRRMNHPDNPKAIYGLEARKLQSIQNDEALARLGYLVQYGRVPERSADECISFYKAAARKGNDFAALRLGICHGEGKLFPQNLGNSSFWMEEAAKNGRPSVRYGVAHYYHKGKYVAQNYERALYWMRAAAEDEFAPAENDLGVWYSEGIGVERDKQQAFYYLLRAANRGWAEAQFNVAIAYINGEGVREDFAAGKRYMVMAADNGHAEAKKFFR